MQGAACDSACHGVPPHGVHAVPGGSHLSVRNPIAPVPWSAAGSPAPPTGPPSACSPPKAGRSPCSPGAWPPWAAAAAAAVGAPGAPSFAPCPCCRRAAERCWPAVPSPSVAPAQHAERKDLKRQTFVGLHVMHETSTEATRHAEAQNWQVKDRTHAQPSEGCQSWASCVPRWIPRAQLGRHLLEVGLLLRPGLPVRSTSRQASVGHLCSGHCL